MQSQPNSSSVWTSWWLSGKESTCNTGNVGSILGWARSSGRGNGNPLHYSCLGNSMRKRAYGLRGHKRVGQGWAHRLSNSVYFHVWYPQLVVHDGSGLLLRRDESGPMATYTWCLYSFNKNWSPFYEVVSSMLGVSRNFFCKGSDYKYFRLCEPYCLCHDFTLAILAWKAALDKVNKWVCLGSNETLCMDTEMWLSYLWLHQVGIVCGIQDLSSLRNMGSSVQHSGSLIAACILLVVACGI